MKRFLIIMFLLPILSACPITPPGSLEAERKKHSDEIRMLELSKQLLSKNLRDTEQALQTCKDELLFERLHRTDARKALAFVRWCDVIGKRFGFCNDELYNDGIKAYYSGERASAKWLAIYFSLTLFPVVLAITIPLGIWMYFRLSHGVRIMDDIEKNNAHLNNLIKKNSNLETKVRKSQSQLEEMADEKERMEATLEELHADIQAARDEIQEIQAFREILDISSNEKNDKSR